VFAEKAKAIAANVRLVNLSFMFILFDTNVNTLRYYTKSYIKITSKSRILFN
jgi:hypothetical protein